MKEWKENQPQGGEKEKEKRETGKKEKIWGKKKYDNGGKKANKEANEVNACGKATASVLLAACVSGKEQSWHDAEAQVLYKHADPQLCASDFIPAFLKDHSLASQFGKAQDRAM